jgi:hypothetical protein
VKFVFIAAEKALYPVVLLCNAPRFHRSSLIAEPPPDPVPWAAS